MRNSAVAKPGTLAHVDALDGIRAVAVSAVLFFHDGLPFAQGGFLGVEAFFVLSGFLITSLLLTEWAGGGRISLRRFWARRARRLLPALFCVVAACAIYELVAGPSRAVPDFGADVLATALYVANWHQIWTGSGYFAQVGLVSPIQHTWSLAIEEQFYLVWPLVLLGLLKITRNVRLLFGATVIVAIASAVEMALLYGGGAGLNRVYYGTDTRAQGLLFGAALAMAVQIRAAASDGKSGPRAGPTRVPAAVGVVGLAGLLATMVLARSTSAWLYRGGFLVVDASVLAVIVSVTSTTPVFSPVRRLLETWPLRKLGLVSYGVYLWHFPLFLWLTTQSTGLAGPRLLVLRLGSTLALSVCSYVVIEQPIRTRRMHGRPLRALVPTCTAATVAAVCLTWGIGSSGTVLTSGAVTLPTTPSGGGVSARGTTCRTKLPLMGTAETFDRCPVVDAMFIGDSIALNLSVDVGMSQQRYGVFFWDPAQLGCGFTTSGLVDVDGSGFGPPDSTCATESRIWKSDEDALHPQAVVVELGLWDEAQWEQDGKPMHLGDRTFDAELSQKMDDLVRTLASPKVPIVFLSVPWVSPPSWPNGMSAPQASASRHRLINKMLASLPHRFPGEAYYFNIAPYVTPGNHFDASVGGQVCRTSDGVHFYVGGPSLAQFVQTRCGLDLEAVLLPYLRHLIQAHSPPT